MAIGVELNDQELLLLTSILQIQGCRELKRVEDELILEWGRRLQISSEKRHNVIAPLKGDQFRTMPEDMLHSLYEAVSYWLETPNILKRPQSFPVMQELKHGLFEEIKLRRLAAMRGIQR